MVQSGSGYTNPTLVVASSISATATATQSGGVVNGITITNNGAIADAGASVYAAPPAITVGPPPSGGAGPGGYLPPLVMPVVQGGAITHLLPACGGLLGYGSGYSIGGSATVSIVGTGAILVPVLGTGANAGKIMSVTVVQGTALNAGDGAYSSSYAVNFADSTGTGATATMTVSSGVIQKIVMGSNGSGYTNPSITIAPAGSAAAFLPIFGSYVPSIPVTNPGYGYNSPPTITISDTGGGTGAVAQAIMSGSFAATVTGTTTSGSAIVTGISSTAGMQVGQSVSGTGIPSGTTIASVNSGTQITLSADATAAGSPTIAVLDTFTYSAPAGWLAATTGGLTLGGLQAVTGAAIQNWTGQREGTTAGLAGFAAAPTLLAGASVGETPSVYWANTTTVQNRMKVAAPWAPSSGTITLDQNDNPLSWSAGVNAAIGATICGIGSTNYVDTMGEPVPFGQWTLQYDDSQVNTASASAVWLHSAAASVTITPVSLSGPNTTYPNGYTIPSANITLTGETVTGISLSGISASILEGYQGAAILISGGGGTYAGAVATVSGGVVTGITIACKGGGYTSKPTVVIYGTEVSGSTVTAVLDVEYIAEPTFWYLGLAVYGANANGVWTVSNLAAVTPNVLAGRTALSPSSIQHTNPVATDANVVAYLTAPNGRGPGALRFMDILNGYGGESNYIDPMDLLALTPARGSWNTNALDTTATFQFVRYMNTNPGSTTYSWSSTKVYGTQAWAISGTDTFTLTGCVLTSGSPVVTGVTGTPMVGAQVTGTGIPAGTQIASVQSATQITLTNSATVSGTETLTTTMGYVSLPTYDNGQFTDYGAGASSAVVLELRSTVPHGLRSGLLCTGYGYTALPVLNLGTPYTPGGNWGTLIWVTGPYTICFVLYAGAPDNLSAPTTINSTTEIPATVSAHRHDGLRLGDRHGRLQFDQRLCGRRDLGHRHPERHDGRLGLRHHDRHEPGCDGVRHRDPHDRRPLDDHSQHPLQRRRRALRIRRRDGRTIPRDRLLVQPPGPGLGRGCTGRSPRRSRPTSGRATPSFWSTATRTGTRRTSRACTAAPSRNSSPTCRPGRPSSGT